MFILHLHIFKLANDMKATPLSVDHWSWVLSDLNVQATVTKMLVQPLFFYRELCGIKACWFGPVQSDIFSVKGFVLVTYVECFF